MYCVVYKNGTSSEHTTNELKRCFPDMVDRISLRDVKYIDTSRYKKILFCYRNTPECLKSIDYNIRNPNILFMSSEKYVHYPIKTVSKGFTEYKKHGFDYYFPLTSLEGSSNTCFSFRIGFYNKKKSIGLDKDERKFLNWYKGDVPVTILGSPLGNFRYTTDKYEFFNEITHLVYFPFEKFDTQPGILYEAVNFGKQIILPYDRIEPDGSTDIKSCIKYHRDFNNKVLDNSNSYIIRDNYIKIYRKIMSNNMEYSFDKSKYNTFEELLEYECNTT